MEASIINTPILAILAVGGLTLLILVFNKMVNDPKLGIYLVIIAAPFTKSFGSNALMKRFTISEVAGLLFVSAWFLNQAFVSDRPRISFSSFSRIAWLLGFVVILSAFTNLPCYTRHAQWITEVMILLYVLVFFTLFEQLIRSDEDISRVINVWLATAGVVVIIGLWDLAAKFWELPSLINMVGERYEWRVSGTFRSTGQLGVYLFTTFWVVLGSCFLPDTSKKYRFALVMLMLGIVVVSLSASRRSAFAGFLVGAGALTLVSLRSAKRLALWSGLALCIALSILVVLSINGDFSRYFSQRVSVLDPATTAEQRPFIPAQLKGIRQAFAENPVLGIGFGGFRYSRYDSTRHEIHSEPGRMLAETGIIGLMLYLFLLCMLLKLAYENAFRLKDLKWSQFSTVIFAALFGLYTSALYNRHLRERSFWILAGIIICVNRLGRQRAEQKQERGT